jgi:hypothetical protein
VIRSRFGAFVFDRYDSLMPTTSVHSSLRSRGGSILPVAAVLLLSGLLGAACSSNTPATPSTTPPAGTPIRERYTSTLPVGGTKFYSFSIATSGNVVATLESIGGDGVPSTVVVDMGVGAPLQTSCSANLAAVQVGGSAGLASVVTSLQQPGVQCVVVSDVGNLFAPATFTVVIDHP